VPSTLRFGIRRPIDLGRAARRRIGPAGAALQFGGRRQVDLSRVERRRRGPAGARGGDAARADGAAKRHRFADRVQRLAGSRRRAGRAGLAPEAVKVDCDVLSADRHRHEARLVVLEQRVPGAAHVAHLAKPQDSCYVGLCAACTKLHSADEQKP
jgi:hypothetical protein